MDEFEDPPVQQQHEPCDICGRTFIPETLVRHRRICEKNAMKKRKVFDSGKQRAEGTDIASVPKTKETKQPPSKIKKNNWRAKHEDFISNIKNARAVTVAIKTGAPLPPPPAQKRTVNPDYVQCPHCTRNFNESAAERHIPWCKEQNSRITNKPKTKSAGNEKVNVRTKVMGYHFRAHRRNFISSCECKKAYKPPLPGSKKKQTLPPPRRSPGNIRQSNSTSDLDKKLNSLHIQDRQRQGHGSSGARGRAAAAAGEGNRTRSLSADRRGGGGGGGSGRSGVTSHRNTSGDGVRKGRYIYDDEEDYGYSPHGRSPSNSHLLANHRNSPNSIRTPTPPSTKPTHNVRRQASLENVNGLKASKFCHECGTKYPVTNAKYCCECGTKRAFHH